MKINFPKFKTHFLNQCCHRRVGDMVSTVDKTGEDLVAWLQRELPKFIQEDAIEFAEWILRTHCTHNGGYVDKVSHTKALPYTTQELDAIFLKEKVK